MFACQKPVQKQDVKEVIDGISQVSLTESSIHCPDTTDSSNIIPVESVMKPAPQNTVTVGHGNISVDLKFIIRDDTEVTAAEIPFLGFSITFVRSSADKKKVTLLMRVKDNHKVAAFTSIKSSVVVNGQTKNVAIPTFSYGAVDMIRNGWDTCSFECAPEETQDQGDIYTMTLVYEEVAMVLKSSFLYDI